LVQRERYTETVFYLDELDLHLNYTLQYNLVKEICDNWLPAGCQLWTASHSLGFIQYARQSETACIVDLDNFDFDVPQIISPEPDSNLDVYEIALPKEIISAILTDKKLVVTENKNSTWYNLALGAKSYLFLPAQNSREVFLTIKGDPNMVGLRDRDFFRDDEIAQITAKYPRLKLLKYYTFENYLFHPDNLAEVITDFDKAAYIAAITKQKNEQLLNIVGKIAVARQTYIEFKEGIVNDGQIETISASLASNEFEHFYRLFNMKDNFKKDYLAPYHLQTRQLVVTQWFKTAIDKVLQ
jgi:hypothetical protein